MSGILKFLLVSVLSLPVFVQAADRPKLTIDLPVKAGGSVQSMGKMLADGLQKLGYDVDLVLSGNCATTVQNMQKQDRPVLTIWGNRLHLQDDKECMIPLPDKTTFVGLLSNSPEYICSVGTGTPRDLFQQKSPVTLSVQPFPWQTDKMVEFLKKHTPTEVRTVIYRNQGAQKTAAAGRETDFMIGTGGLNLQENGLVTCQYNTGNRVVENTKPLSTVVPGALQSWMTQYARAKNLSPKQMETLREDIRKIIVQDDWQKYMKSLRFDTMQDRTVMQQLDFVNQGIRDLR